MANQVEIDVVLNGAEEASRGLGKIGETSAAMADRFAEGNEKLGEGLGSLVGNVEELGGSFLEFGSTVDRVSGQGVKSLASLLPALGGVAAAGYALYETFLNISGAAQEAEQATEAMSSAASDLQSRLESLTENGIKLSTKELQNYTRATLEAEFSKTLLESKMNSLKSVMGDYSKATSDVAKAELVLSNKSATGKELIEAAKQKVIATKQQIEANEKLNKGLAEYEIEQARVMKLIQKRTDLDEKHAKTTKEAILNEVKSNIEKRARIQLLQAEANLSGDELELVKLQIEEQKALALASAESFKESKVRLNAFGIDIKQALDDAREGLSDAEILSRAHEARQVRLLEEAGVKQYEARKKTGSSIKKLRVNNNAEELALARRHEQELRMIRALELQSMEINGVDQLEILRLRYEDELKLAKDSLSAQRIARLQYENAVDRIVQDDIRKNEEREKRRQAKLFENREFDLSFQKDSLEKEIALLELRYEKELELNAKTQEDITEIQRRQTIERQSLFDRSFDASMDKLKSISEDFAKSSIESVYENLVNAGNFDLQFEELQYQFDQNIIQTRNEMMQAQAAEDVDLVRQKEQQITDITERFETERRKLRTQESQAIPLMFGQLLKGLGQEAAVEAVMETARGLSKLGSPITAGFAAAHFKAAAVFAGVSALTGLGGSALANNANTAISRAGRSSSNVSPSGSPTSSATPEREKADSREIVYNINFGGAVIYDTKTAAEQAFADRLTNLQNRTRRGSPRQRA